MLSSSDLVSGQTDVTPPYLVEVSSGLRRGAARPARARHYKLLMVSPADNAVLHQALLRVRPEATGGPVAELVLAIDPAGSSLRLEGPLLPRLQGCQLVLADAAGGPAMVTLSVAQPLQHRTAGRLDGLLTVSGWPAPKSLFAGRCLLRRLGTNDHATLLADGRAGTIPRDAPGAQRTLAYLRRLLDGPHLTLV